MQQRNERDVHADFIGSHQIAVGKAGGVADMQLRYGHAGAWEEARTNRAERDFPASLFRNGVGNRAAIVIDVYKIGQGKHGEE